MSETNPPYPDSLRRAALSGTFWMNVNMVAGRGLGIAQTIILAKLLVPDQFGTVAVFFILSGALEAFTKTGFTKALVRHPQLDRDSLDTAWTVSVLRGLMLAGLLFFLAPIVVGFLETPNALPVVRVLALSLLLRGLYNTGVIHFQRDLNFFKQFLWRFNTTAVNCAVSIPLAFLWKNEWALVAGVLASEAVAVGLSFTLHRYRPHLRFNRMAFEALFHYGKWILFSSVLAFCSRQLDRVFVAKWLGEESLGLYVVAYRFARIPEWISNEIPNVLFPIYSRIQEDRQAVRRMYIRALRVILFVCIPVVGLIVVLSEPFIRIVLGEEWLGATRCMQLLTVATGVNVVTFTSMSLFNALGRPHFPFRVNLLKLILFSACGYFLVRNLGLPGMALCAVIMAVGAILLWKVEIHKLLNVGWKDLRFGLWPIGHMLVLTVVSYVIQDKIPCSRFYHLISLALLLGFLYVCLSYITNRWSRTPVFADLTLLFRDTVS